MKLFLDTANIDEIKEAVDWGVISGVTTNPSLAAKENQDFIKSLVTICEMVDGPVSAEVISLEYEGMLKEARKLAGVHSNVVVKVPIIPEGMKAVKTLSAEGIKVNVTLVFSANQALLAARAGAAYISPFLGRLDDIGHTGVELVHDIVNIIDMHNLDSEVISASIRHTEHVPAVALAGSHIATMPYKVLKQMFKHPLTDKGIESFLNDWKKLNQEI